MNKKQSQGRPTTVPFTAEELMSMFGLTVEQAIYRGYKIVKKKKPPRERALPRWQR